MAESIVYRKITFVYMSYNQILYFALNHANKIVRAETIYILHCQNNTCIICAMIQTVVACQQFNNIVGLAGNKDNVLLTLLTS